MKYCPSEDEYSEKMEISQRAFSDWQTVYFGVLYSNERGNVTDDRSEAICSHFLLYVLISFPYSKKT
jgi:hypothetical protein